MTQVLNLEADSALEHLVNVHRDTDGLWHHAHDSWPAGVVELDSIASRAHRDEYEAIVRHDGAIARIAIHDGFAYVNAYADSNAGAKQLLEQLRIEIPRAEDNEPAVVPVTFWSLSPMGPQSMQRRIDAPAFDDIERNYPAAGELMSMIHDWRPGDGGQLLLWHGEAGTGKTTAMRALGREWRDWAELHYIVDPDKFFGDSASYMMQVMMGEGEIVSEGAEPKWRVLLLEDCGEMLSPDARQQVGQALSRLLNTCDGLIGRGLRLLILITTNEELDKLHPAISRPGRCAHQIKFPRFTALEAAEWLGEDWDGPEIATTGQLTLADLYEIRERRRSVHAKQAIGFTS